MWAPLLAARDEDVHGCIDKGMVLAKMDSANSPFLPILNEEATCPSKQLAISSHFPTKRKQETIL
jgi:hypothetical protein